MGRVWSWFAVRRFLRASALLGTLTLGCSALLGGQATQCHADSDCEQLGFAHWTCNASQVCVAPASGGSSSGASSGDAGSPAGGASVSGGPGRAGSESGTGGRPSAGQGGEGASAGAPRPFAGSGGQSAGGGGASAGTSGSAGSAVSGAGAAGAPPIPDWNPLSPSGGASIRVRSFCKQPLWVHTVSSQSGTLTPDDTEVKTNGDVDLATPGDWLGGDVQIFGTAARGELLHDVAVSRSQGVMYYSLQYTAGFGLPVEIVGYGGTCSPVAQKRVCAAHEADVASCPGALKDGARCLSAGAYCAFQANRASAYCHALDGAIAGCSGCPGGSTLDVYAGSGNYLGEARLGAALNRGMSAQPDETNSALFYQQTPFNTYGKWLHGLCPSAIAFAHDEYGTTPPLYVSCNASELRITLCPAR